jgi:hypothetical protein
MAARRARRGGSGVGKALPRLPHEVIVVTFGNHAFLIQFKLERRNFQLVLSERSTCFVGGINLFCRDIQPNPKEFSA